MDNNTNNSKFIQDLFAFLKSRGVQNLKIPQIGGKELDLEQLYHLVISKGGAESVSSLRLWRDIVLEFDFPSTCTSATFTLKNNYQKYLLAYEQKFFFNKEENDMVTYLEPQRQKRGMRDKHEGIYNKIINKNLYEAKNNNSTINKIIKENDTYFVKRKNFLNFDTEIKHLEMLFSDAISIPNNYDIIYGINMMLLFSNSKHLPFSIDNNKILFNHFLNYFYIIIDNLSQKSQIKIKNIKKENKNDTQFENLLNIILVIRNLLLVNINIDIIINNSKLFEYLEKCLVLYRNINNKQLNNYMLEILYNYTNYIKKDNFKYNTIFIHYLIGNIILSSKTYLKATNIIINLLTFNLISEEDIIYILTQIKDILLNNLLNDNQYIFKNTVLILYILSNYKKNKINDILSENNNLIKRIVYIINGTYKIDSYNVNNYLINILLNLLKYDKSVEFIKKYNIDLITHLTNNNIKLFKKLKRIITYI